MVRGPIAPALNPFVAIDARQIWNDIWQGKTIILLSIVAALGLAALVVAVVPFKYTATAQILIDPMELNGAPHEVTSNTQQSDAMVFTIESQVSVITADGVLRQVVQAEGLDRDPEFSRGSGAVDYGALTALDELRRHLAVTRAERTYVVDIKVTSLDAAKAARIANAIVKAYLAEQTDNRAADARQVSQSLSARLNDLQDGVRDAEDRVEAYKRQTGIVNANGELLNEQQLARLDDQLTLAHAHTVEARTRLDEVERVQKSHLAVGAFPDAI